MTVGPSSNRVEIGGTVKFTATVSDVVEKFRYQWRQNNVEIDRATSSTYTIKKVKERHQGDYDCIVCNEYEEKVASNKANLVVYSELAYVCVIVIPRARVLCLIYTHKHEGRRPECECVYTGKAQVPVV